MLYHKVLNSVCGLRQGIRDFSYHRWCIQIVD